MAFLPQKYYFLSEFFATKLKTLSLYENSARRYFVPNLVSPEKISVSTHFHRFMQRLYKYKLKQKHTACLLGQCVNWGAYSEVLPWNTNKIQALELNISSRRRHKPEATTAKTSVILRPIFSAEREIKMISD